MTEGRTIRCQSCGATRETTTPNPALAECWNCGELALSYVIEQGEIAHCPECGGPVDRDFGVVERDDHVIRCSGDCGYVVVSSYELGNELPEPLEYLEMDP